MGLTAAGLLVQEPFDVDILKLPHHGSSVNEELGFFERVTADYYVVSPGTARTGTRSWRPSR
jgi:beta-lactamase superfamily II metal-dependent hydrolase